MSGYKRVNFYELCRLCATNQQRHVTTHIFKEEGKRMQLQDKIHNCLSLKVDEDDFLPKVVCSKCLAVLEQSNTFRKECVKSELMLSTYYNNYRYTPDFTESGKVYIKDISTPMLPNLPCILQNQTILPTNAEPPKLIPKPASGNSSFAAVNTNGEVITILECAAKPSNPRPVKNKKVAQNMQNVKQAQSTVLVDNSNVPYATPPKKQRIKIDSKQHIIPASQLEPTLNNTQQTLDIDLDSIHKETHVNHGSNIYHQLKPVAISANQLATLQNQTYTTQYIDSQYTQQQYSSDAITSNSNPQFSSNSNTQSQNITSNNQWLTANRSQENLIQQQHNVIMTSPTVTMSSVQTSNAMTVVNNNNTNEHIVSSIGMNNLNIQSNHKILPKLEPIERKCLTTIDMDSISTTASEGGGNNMAPGQMNVSVTTNGGVYTAKVKKESGLVKHHVCDVCAKVFKRREHLYQHMKLHSGFRPFTCAVCAKTFMRKEHLLRHQTSHSGQKNYTCTVCDKSFSRNDNLLKHKKTHDKQPVQYECDKCTKVFVLKHYFITHKLTHDMQPNQKQNQQIKKANTSNCWQGQQNTVELLKA